MGVRLLALTLSVLASWSAIAQQSPRGNAAGSARSGAVKPRV